MPQNPGTSRSGNLPRSFGPLTEHPVAAAHRGRRKARTDAGARVTRASLHDRDVNVVLKPGWLPTADDLPPEDEQIKFIGMDQLRQEHARHLEQLDSARQTLADLTTKFEQEDTEHHATLTRAFEAGDEHPVDKRTPRGEREELLARAHETLDATRAVAVSWAEGALQRARDLTPDWAQAIAVSHGRLTAEIEEHQAQIAQLRDEQRADMRFVMWSKRLMKPIAGNQTPFGGTRPGALPSDTRTTPYVHPSLTTAAPPGLPPEDDEQTAGAA